MLKVPSFVLVLLGILATPIALGQEDREPEVKATPVKTVQASYLRMHSPQLFGSLISTAKGASRNQIISNFFPSRQRSRALGATFQTPKVGAVSRWGSISSVANVPGEVLDFGSHFQINDPTALANETYEGIGTKDGVLTLELSKTGAFRVTNLYTTTGDVDAGGKPVVKDTATKVDGNRLKVPIFEGQSYFVNVTMPISVPGIQQGAISIQDGISTTLSLKGKVDSPKGELLAAFGSTQITLAYRQKADLKLFVCTNGNTDSKLTWKIVENPGALAVSNMPVAMKKVDTQEADLNVKTSAGTKSGTYPLVLECSAFNGNAKVTISTQVTVTALWVEDSTENTYLAATFLGNSDGDWCITVTPSASLDITKGNEVGVFLNTATRAQVLWLDNPNVFGATFQMSEPKFMISAGNDPYIVGNYINLISNETRSCMRAYQSKKPINQIAIKTLLSPKGKNVSVHQLIKG